MQQLEANDEAWRRMTPVIDEALAHLGAADRDVILLRYIEGRSHASITRYVVVSEDQAVELSLGDIQLQ